MSDANIALDGTITFLPFLVPDFLSLEPTAVIDGDESDGDDSDNSTDESDDDESDDEEEHLAASAEVASYFHADEASDAERGTDMFNSWREVCTNPHTQQYYHEAAFTPVELCVEGIC